MKYFSKGYFDQWIVIAINFKSDYQLYTFPQTNSQFVLHWNQMVFSVALHPLKRIALVLGYGNEIITATNSQQPTANSENHCAVT